MSTVLSLPTAFDPVSIAKTCPTLQQTTIKMRSSVLIIIVAFATTAFAAPHSLVPGGHRLLARQDGGVGSDTSSASCAAGQCTNTFGPSNSNDQNVQNVGSDQSTSTSNSQNIGPNQENQDSDSSNGSTSSQNSNTSSESNQGSDSSSVQGTSTGSDSSSVQGAGSDSSS